MSEVAYVGNWDRLFGKRTELRVPLPDGTSKTVIVTEKWLQSMMASGRLEHMPVTAITAYVLDLATNALREMEAFLANDYALVDELHSQPEGPTVETWEIGKQISKEEYGRVCDPGTRCVYVVYGLIKGEKTGTFYTRERWEFFVKYYRERTQGL